ncbi:DUF6397 family protein [Streptomyces netropsis]|uniref:DUF6397 family protein n=1 Tax=Streptomyces netropsis TaxID=55404 RepID=UPI0037BCF63C
MAVQQREVRGATEESVAFGRAARELELKPREFELAVQLGDVRTVASGPGRRRRVTRAEIERHRSADGFPEGLRSRLWVVGTAEGAELMGISPARFGRLARGGCFAPVRFYVNRYRAVVWHYLAADLVDFADRNPELLTGRTPSLLRTALEEREDRRGRSWRARRLDQLLAQTEDPWERAAVAASVLTPEDLAAGVPDQDERAYVTVLRPPLVPARPDAMATHEVIESVILAEDPDEIEWHRHRLTAALAQARAVRPAPARDVPPGPMVSPAAPMTGTEALAGTEAPAEMNAVSAAEAVTKRTEPVRPRGLWARLRRRT